MQIYLMVRRISFWNSLPEAMGTATVKMRLDKFRSRHYRQSGHRPGLMNPHGHFESCVFYS